MMDAYSCSDSLIRKLQEESLVLETSKEFVLFTQDNSQKILFAEKLLKKWNLMPTYDQFKITKCNIKAEEYRNLGNQLYKDKKFYEALVSYNKSLCHSPEDSQNLGTGFANRSAVYFEMKEYEKCLENIELAKNYNYPKEKIVKLNKREEQALEKFNNGPDPSQKLIKYEAARERFLKSKLKANGKYNFFVANCLEVKTSPEFGRYLVTNQDLKVGSVIAVEKPFSKIVVPAAIYERCANCLGRNLLSLLPCLSCCSAMFCSEECRTIGQEKFHKFECGLVNAIDELISKTARLALRTYFEALHVCGTPTKLREFLNSIKDSKATILDFDYTDEDSFRKNSLHSIDALVTVEKSDHCNVGDLFQRSNVCAVICNLILNHSEALKSILVEPEDRNVFREFIFKYTQISSMNFHGLYCTTESDADQVQFGSGSYAFCSLINHSCAPNIIRVTYETSNYIVVNRPIRKGGQIFDNYGYHHCLESLESRRKGLLDQYRFFCFCEGCQKDYPNLLILKVKDDKLNQALKKDFPSLVLRDLDKAVECFDKYCKLIDKLDQSDYPSYELSSLQEMMLYCLRIFSKNEAYGM